MQQCTLLSKKASKKSARERVKQSNVHTRVAVHKLWEGRARVVPEADVVALVDERHDALRVVLGDGKEVLENVLGPLAELGGKVVKDEMGERFGHGSCARNIVPHHSVGERERRCGAKWEVAHDQAVGFSTMLVNDYEIRHLVRHAQLRRAGPCRM